ncbi:protein-L-isoaspartate(D-aspartate) O-methyltransferase-like [Tropilaelaps mercedesae]|uniref:protein-L-isoaspartate(D-aspartate) O-methyltransferase n=1 Tax=Tropilaelaps mercedesae TaxID=418985 RepID=A0A1V9Y3E6_9ACAR|nr:protein-L-isoaspartate(D-aspartate) O-methyltransferase-like [Tropilaelaps mercedesae]
MKQVDRKDFCVNTRSSYDDAPQGIGYAVTISAPHMHAYALEALSDKLIEGSRALDVGSGSGYLTTCMAVMTGPTGRVVGIDHIPELVEMSIKNVRKNNSKLLDSGQLQLIVGDGRKGYPAEGPYDVIHVGAAADKLPKELIDQLRPGGRHMQCKLLYSDDDDKLDDWVCPVGGEFDHQELLRIDKKPDGSLEKQSLMGVRYVPLTDKDKQWPGRIS